MVMGVGEEDVGGGGDEDVGGGGGGREDVGGRECWNGGEGVGGGEGGCCGVCFVGNVLGVVVRVVLWKWLLRGGLLEVIGDIFLWELLWLLWSG